jgi:hypothetical protein
LEGLVGFEYLREVKILLFLERRFQLGVFFQFPVAELDGEDEV